MPTYPLKKLSEICKIKTGKKDVNEGNTNGKFPFFTCARKHTFSNSYSFDMEALLIAGNGDVGHVQYYKGKFEAYQRTYILHDFTSNVSVQYLYLYLNSFLKETVSRQKLGNTMPYIKLGMLTDFQIPFPPISVQEEIVAKLDSALVSIDEAKTKTEQALAATHELWESTLEEAFRGDDGWEEKRLEDCFKMKSGDMMTGKTMNKSGMYPVFGGNGIAGMHDAFNLEGENVIIGRVGALCGNVRYIKERIWLTDNAFKITDYKVKFNYIFLTYLLNFKNLRNFARQAAQPVISNSSLKDVILYFPNSLPEQSRIVTHLDAVRAETDRLASLYEQKLADLDELRRSVLQEAFAQGA